jgi:chemotaxis protein methyltransferase CheR
VHGLFYDSLVKLGVLALGSRETPRFTPYEACYQAIDAEQRIYRKVA